MRRDVLQLGVGQDPASHLLPQPLPIRPSSAVDRAHRRRSAIVPLVLPPPVRATASLDRYRARSAVGAPLRRFSPRLDPFAGGVSPALSTAVHARRQPSDPSAV